MKISWSKGESGGGDWRGRLVHLLVEADHFSGVNRYLPWRTPLGTLLMVGVAAGLCGWLMHGNAFVLLAGIAGVLGLGLVWPWISIRSLSGEMRFLDERVSEGDRTVVEFEFLNRCPVGLWGVRIQGDVGLRREGQAGDSFVYSLVCVPGWRRSRFRWEFQADQRGEYPGGELRISTAFPFGLWEVSKRLNVAGGLLVWPRTFVVDEIPEAAANERSVDGRAMKNRAGYSGDLLGLRAYRPGDPLKRIHWIQSARHDQLIVCEQQASAAPRAQIVLDLDAGLHCGVGDQSTREWGIRIGASVCRGLLEGGAAVEIAMSDRFMNRVKVSSIPELLDRMARIQPGDGEPINELLNRGEVMDFRDGLQLVMTTATGLKKLRGASARRSATHYVAIHPARSEGDGSGSVNGPENDGEIVPWIEVTVSRDLPEAFRDQWQSMLCSN